MSMAVERAMAIRTAGGWVLKKICPPQTGAWGVAVRVGGGWGLAAQGVSGSRRYLAVRVGGTQALVGLECPEDPPGCEGNDPRCGICACEAALAAAYQVSISGFPDVCGLGAFNGTWTLQWREECVWQYDIDAYRSVRLSGQEGPFWRITWAVAGAGGISGYFGGQDGEGCAPETQEYVHWQVSSTAGCTGLLSALYNSVAMTLSRADS